MALQKSAFAYFLGFLSNLLILLGTLLLVNYTKGNIVILSFLTGGIPILVLAIASLILYRSKLSYVRPSFKNIKKTYAKDILLLGYKFFIIQIASIILYYCDNIIIAQLFSPVEVTVYNISYKYFNSIMVILTILLTPYWSAITEAAALNDYKWMNFTYKQLINIWFGVIILTVLMVLLSDKVYNIWIGDKIKIPYMLTYSMAVYQIVMSWNRIVTVIANGVGKVKLQLYYTIASAVINIPLALFLSKNILHSAAGVTLATTISSLLCTYIGTVQTRKILNKRAYGIWDK
jgi:O-antigen/teichoic acid export membrane protein